MGKYRAGSPSSCCIIDVRAHAVNAHVHAHEFASSYNEFRRGIPRDFVEQCQSCGWRRSWRECICGDVLSVDDLMMRGSQCGGWSTHLLPHGRRSDLEILPNPLMGTRMNRSLRAQSVRKTPSGFPMARSYRGKDDGCNFASCPDRAHAGAGHFFPVWGSGGNIVCVDGASPPSWALGAYLMETKSDCCKAYSMLRVSKCLSA